MTTSIEVLTPPKANEIEVSVFGPGVGECVVVHLGDNEWLVVDSCLDRDSKLPIAQVYLESIGVSVESAVRVIVCSHWHNDHTKGIEHLARSASAARVFISGVLGTREFLTIVGTFLASIDSDTGIDALAELYRDLLARKKAGGDGIGWATQDRIIFEGLQAKVRVLSPTDGTKDNEIKEMSSLIREGGPARRLVVHDANELSVSLWITTSHATILLGADLENGRDDNSGWRGVVRNMERESDTATVYKVSHHGSEGADYSGVWDSLLEEGSLGVMTPFRAQSIPIPRKGDLKRIRKASGRLFLSAPPRGRKPRFTASQQRMAKRLTVSIQQLWGDMGHVRLRKSPQSEWSAECFGAAEEV